MRNYNFIPGTVVTAYSGAVTFVFDSDSNKIAELHGGEIATVLSDCVPPKFRGGDYLFAKILTSTGVVGYAMIDFMRAV